ncbi:MAG: T9SS type A sorting domain-containing protein, partial [Bacteroidota bacterium]
AISDSLDFEITTGGEYGIYSMVYLDMPGTYDYFDDSFIIVGQTSIFEIESAMQMQNVCADIDIDGVKFLVLDCGADAGALDVPTASSLNGGQATISSSHTVPPSVPSGYDVKYLLSRGSNAIFIDMADRPEFDVSAADEYGIHTLVYDPSSTSVNFLDLSFYTLGSSKIADIAAQITADRLCADLDFNGAAVDIDSCKADGGVLVMAADTASLRVGPVNVEAFVIESPVVPSGYSLRYLLTSGADQVIEAIGNTPIFSVNSSAPYEIHSLVYNADPNSPDFLDLSAIDLGEDELSVIQTPVDSSGICADMSSPASPTLVVSAVFFIKFELSEKPGPKNVLLWILSEAVRDGVYSVERSIDGILYNVIYTRKELTSARSPVTYVYVDVEPRPGKNYYRIKFTNIDNSFFYSRVILVENEVTITPEFKIYPNPSFGEVNFEPQFLNPGIFEVRIVDARGATVYFEAVDFGEEALKTINIEHLPRGLYHVNFLNVSTGEQSSYNLLRHQERP